MLIEKQDAVIATWREGHPQRVMLESKKSVHTWMILMMTTMMSLKMKVIKFQQ
jgi:hypothetical protein